MSSCSRISAEALLQSVQEMVQSLSVLHDLRRRVREAEASFAKAKRLRHDGLLPDGVEKHFEPLPRLTRVAAVKKIMAKKPPSQHEPPLEMRPRSLLELDGTDCRWPLGDVHEVAVLFCGASKGPGYPYCGHHLRMAQARAANSCECDAPYVPAGKRAAVAIATTPEAPRQRREEPEDADRRHWGHPQTPTKREQPAL